MIPNSHNFDFQIPLHPQDHTKLEMDGKPLQGVTDLTIKAGVNGYTNVVIGFEAPAMVSFAGALIARMNGMTNEEQCLALAGQYREARAEIEKELEQEGAELDSELMAQAQLVRRIIELCVENIK